MRKGDQITYMMHCLCLQEESMMASIRIRILPSSPNSNFSNPNPFNKPFNSRTRRCLLMLAKSQHQHTSLSLIRMGSSINIQKVFEDKSRGIVCYLDDKGEITCEGYDEGPRFHLHHHHQPSRFSRDRGEQQHIVDLLQRSLLLQQHIDGSGASKLN